MGEVVGATADPGSQDHSLWLAVTTWQRSPQQSIRGTETDGAVGSTVSLAHEPGDRFDKGE